MEIALASACLVMALAAMVSLYLVVRRLPRSDWGIIDGTVRMHIDAFNQGYKLGRAVEQEILSRPRRSAAPVPWQLMPEDGMEEAEESRPPSLRRSVEEEMESPGPQRDEVEVARY